MPLVDVPLPDVVGDAVGIKPFDDRMKDSLADRIIRPKNRMLPRVADSMD